jgi:hypothetical protein
VRSADDARHGGFSNPDEVGEEHRSRAQPSLGISSGALKPKRPGSSILRDSCALCSATSPYLSWALTFRSPAEPPVM